MEQPRESLHPYSLRLCLCSMFNPIPSCSHKPDRSWEPSSPTPQDASKPLWLGQLLQQGAGSGWGKEVALS